MITEKYLDNNGKIVEKSKATFVKIIFFDNETEDAIRSWTIKIDSNIQKAKVYVKNPQEVPQGAKLQHGQRGGQYYESTERQHFRTEVSSIAEKIKQQMHFSPQEIQEASNIISKAGQIVTNEFKRIVSATNGNVSYRVKNRWSILEKVRRKGYKISDMQDILGMRIEVNNVDEIYNTVKKLENIYGDNIIVKEDYISQPKGVYRAYHMNVKFGDVVGEIQIRTPLMDKIANASHILLYKNTNDMNEETKSKINENLLEYSKVSVNEMKQEDLKIEPKVKEILRGFGL